MQRLLGKYEQIHNRKIIPAIADSSVFANVIKVGKVSVSGEPIYGRKGTRHFLKILISGENARDADGKPRKHVVKILLRV